jgi:hypothetical protein
LAVVLVPASGEDMMINWWNWRPTVALLVRSGILPAGEREERCLCNFSGGHLSGSEAVRAAEHIESLVATMNEKQRILLDGEVTEKPKNYSKPISEWDEADTWNSYSVRYDVLMEFAAFCRRSGGFKVV